MAKYWRRTLTLGCVVVTGIVGTTQEASGQARADETVSGKTNAVRSEDAQIRSTIDEASRRSSTFRDLVGSISKTDGVVYVERGRCGRGVRACLLMAVTVAGPLRLLRVRLDPQRRDDELIVSLGHELRHALEILAEPAIRSGASMLLYYKRFGTWLGDATFETPAAKAASDAIQRELRQSAGR
jgi:hypothetical protein